MTTKVWDRVYILMVWLPREPDERYLFWLGADA